MYQFTSLVSSSAAESDIFLSAEESPSDQIQNCNGWHWTFGLQEPPLAFLIKKTYEMAHEINLQVCLQHLKKDLWGECRNDLPLWWYLDILYIVDIYIPEHWVKLLMVKPLCSPHFSLHHDASRGRLRINFPPSVFFIYPLAHPSLLTPLIRFRVSCMRDTSHRFVVAFAHLMVK